MNCYASLIVVLSLRFEQKEICQCPHRKSSHALNLGDGAEAESRIGQAFQIAEMFHDQNLRTNSVEWTGGNCHVRRCCESMPTSTAPRSTRQAAASWLRMGDSRNIDRCASELPTRCAPTCHTSCGRKASASIVALCANHGE